MQDVVWDFCAGNGAGFSYIGNDVEFSCSK